MDVYMDGEFVFVHLWVFLCVHDRRNGNTEVGCRSPEIYICARKISHSSGNDETAQSKTISLQFHNGETKSCDTTLLMSPTRYYGQLRQVPNSARGLKS